MSHSSSHQSTRQEIIDHYRSFNESQRLINAFGNLERKHTQDILSRLLPPSPASIIDVGGGSGAYSFWIASLGYQVHLIDLVPKHVKQARQHSQTHHVHLASMQVGDARQLAFPSQSAEAMICHGPLYHLITPHDRAAVLHEAHRILKPNGLLFAFGITRYAGLTYALTKGLVFDANYQAMIQREVRHGRRTDPPSWANTFNKAYFHLPQELAHEVSQANFEVESTLGVIGPAWLVPDLDQKWAQPDTQEVILGIARLVEHEPLLAPRVVVIGRKRP